MITRKKRPAPTPPQRRRRWILPALRRAVRWTALMDKWRHPEATGEAPAAAA